MEEATRQALRELWGRSFGHRFSEEDAAHAYGGVHVLARAGDDLIGHGSAVPRRIRFGGQPWRSVGYVEAVATDPAWQGRGIGRRVVGRLNEEAAARWPVAVLSTGAPRFYERLGWERWRGPSSVVTAAGTVPDPEDEGLMVLRLDLTVVPDLTVEITCEDRPGDAW